MLKVVADNKVANVMLEFVDIIVANRFDTIKVALWVDSVKVENLLMRI